MSALRWAATAGSAAAVPAVYLGHSPWGLVALALAFLAADAAREIADTRRALVAQFEPLYAAQKRAEAQAAEFAAELATMRAKLQAVEQTSAAAQQRMGALEQRIFGGALRGPL